MTNVFNGFWSVNISINFESRSNTKMHNNCPPKKGLTEYNFSVYPKMMKNATSLRNIKRHTTITRRAYFVSHFIFPFFKTCYHCEKSVLRLHVFLFHQEGHVSHTLQPLWVRVFIRGAVVHSSMASGSWKMTAGRGSFFSVRTFSLDFSMVWKCWGEKWGKKYKPKWVKSLGIVCGAIVHWT